MSRRPELDDDPYSFGSAFSDEGFEDDATPTTSFTGGLPDAGLDGGARSGAPSGIGGADGMPSFGFGAPAGAPHAGQPTPRHGPRIDPGTVAPALGVYTPARPSASSLDYVFAEDYKTARKKSPGEQLTYLTGGSYLAGLLAGGATGFATAVRGSQGKTGKLRLNAILNATGKRGALLANSTGVLALMFSLSETGMYNLTSDDSALNYAAAGALAGGLFKSTRGLRVASLWAAGGAAIAVGAVYASREGIYGRRMQGVL